jgi:two-component system, LuxR family, sensor kinase FixL
MKPHFPGTTTQNTGWFELLFQQISDGAVVFDPESWRILEINPAALALFGTRESEVAPSDVRDVLPTDALIEIGQLMRSLTDGELAENCIRTEIGDTSDETVSVRIRVSQRIEGRRRTGLLLIQRELAEDAIIAASSFSSSATGPGSPQDTDSANVVLRHDLHSPSSSDDPEKFVSIAERVCGFFWERDTEPGCFTFVSPQAVDLLGYPRERWLTEPDFFPSIIHDDDRNSTLEFSRLQTAAGADHSMEYRMITAAGNVVWVRDIVYVVRQPDGPPILHGLILDVTNADRIRDRLRQSEDRFERLFNDSPASLWEMDWSAIKCELDRVTAEGVEDLGAWFDEFPQELARLARLGRVVNVNRVTLDLYAADSVASFVGGLGSVFREDSLPVFRKHLIARHAGAVQFESDNVTYALSGERLLVHVSVTAAAGCEKSWSRLYASVRDVTRRRHAELLRDGQRRVLELLAEGSDVDEVLTVLVDEVERQSPFLRCVVFQVTSADERLGSPIWSQAPEEVVTLLSGRSVEELIPQALALNESGVEFSVDDSNDASRFPPAAPLAIRRAAAACGCLDSRVIPLRNHESRTVGVLVLFRAEEAGFSVHEREVIINFRRLARLVLTHEHNRRALLVRTSELQSVFDTCPDALVRVARDGTILEQYSGEPLSDIPPAEVIETRQRLWNLFSMEAGDRIRSAMWLVDEGSPIETIDFTIAHKNGDRSIEARFVALGQSGEQIAILRDVSRLKRTEQALQNISQRFKDLFDSSPDGIFVETLDGKILDANPAACELHGLTHRELVGRDALDLVPPGEHEAVAGRVMPVMTGEVSEFESQVLKSDNAVIPVNIRATVVRYDGIAALLLHVRDITDRRRSEDQRREQERQMAHVSRLTMMGQLVAGIAHEIRQPLWSISTFADVASELLTLENAAERLSKLREIVTKIVGESRRANNITTRMLSFARKGQPERAEVESDSLIRNAVAIAAARARASQVGITLEVAGDLPRVTCDSVLIEQTIVNLLNNACRALEQQVTGRRRIAVAAERDGDFVWIRVSDNGPGLPDGVDPDLLFEGFFTTSHSGMGIGLALSRSFIEDHGGQILAVPNSGRGMTFEFSIRIDGKADPNE